MKRATPPEEPPTERLELVEERPVLDKRVVDGATLSVRTHVETVDQVVEAALQREDVEVERVPIGAVVDSPPGIREENGVLIVPIIEERLVVQKQLVVTEEIRITRHQRVERVREPVSLRVERAEIARDETTTDSPRT
jgi:uncharacterized protein (TIGR02271 family)